MAPKILKFFLVVFDIYTQPWTKLQNEIQKFCFFRTGYRTRCSSKDFWLWKESYVDRSKDKS